MASAKLALTSGSAGRYGAAGLLAAMALATIWSAAYADGRAIGGCIGGSRAAVNCVVRWGEGGDPYVRLVPQPIDEAERARAAERDRKWEQRCRPVIAQDRFGVPRYQYGAAGCEYGVIE